MMGKIFHNCKNHNEDDHLLLRLLVFLSSDDDIGVMLNNAPVHIVALRIADLWWEANDGIKEVIINQLMRTLCGILSNFPIIFMASNLFVVNIISVLFLWTNLNIPL